MSSTSSPELLLEHPLGLLLPLVPGLADPVVQAVIVVGVERGPYDPSCCRSRFATGLPSIRSQAMRVLTWNMNAPFGGQDRHDRAWSHLLERDDFDVGLLQETQEPPAWARDAFPDCVWRPKYADTGRGKRWGCAVISRTLELEPYEPEERFPWLRARAGATAIARVYTNPTWLASVHFTHKPVPPELLVELGGKELRYLPATARSSRRTASRTSCITCSATTGSSGAET